LLLLCVASDTDWEHAGITGMTVIVRGLIQRDPAGRLRLTKKGAPCSRRRWRRAADRDGGFKDLREPMTQRRAA